MKGSTFAIIAALLAGGYFVLSKSGSTALSSLMGGLGISGGGGSTGPSVEGGNASTVDSGAKSNTLLSGAVTGFSTGVSDMQKTLSNLALYGNSPAGTFTKTQTVAIDASMAAATATIAGNPSAEQLALIGYVPTNMPGVPYAPYNVGLGSVLLPP